LLRGVDNPKVRVVEGGVNISDSGISSKYTFDNYVVGSSNKIVYEIAKEVSENPGGG